MATKLRYRVVFVCFLFVATSAWCRPATVEIFCPWATAERAPLRISIASAVDPERFPEIKFQIIDASQGSSSPGPIRDGHLPLRNTMEVEYGTYSVVISAINAGPDATVDYSRRGITFGNLSLPPSAYRITATAQPGVTVSKLLDTTFTAASGQNYPFVVEQR